MKANGLLPVSLFLVCVIGANAQATPPVTSIQRTSQALNKVPLGFEVNRGQADKAVQFLCRGSGYALYLGPETTVLKLERQMKPQPISAQTAPIDVIHMTLLGADRKAIGEATDKQPGVVSYFIGNDPSQWHAGLPTYGKIRYANIYPGIDLVFYGNQRQLEYDFVLAPGADPGRIAWQIEGAQPRIDSDGSLDLNTPNGPASFKKPLLYQTIGDKTAVVDGAFTVAANRVGFRIGSYDRSRPLVIDPVLVYASYLGGSRTDNIGFWNGPGILGNNPSQGLAIDSQGSVYVTGYTTSVDFPTKNAYQSAAPTKGTNARSVFVSKFSPDGNSLEYSTYLAGSGYDNAYAIAVDTSGSAYLAGQTNSNDFPITPGAYQSLCAPNPANPPNPITANCNSSNISTFLTKLNSTGTALLYSTFLGGYAYSYGTAVAVDSVGRAYVAGVENVVCNPQTYAFPACFPTTSGAVIGGSATNGRSPLYSYVSVFDPTGSQLLYSTLFGDLNGLGDNAINGSGNALPSGVTVDSNGNFYLVGYTQAGQLKTTSGVIQPTSGPDYPGSGAINGWRGMVAKFNPVTSSGGASLAYATYLGGQAASTQDFISGITTDVEGNAYLVGNTNSRDYPVTTGAYNTVCGPNGAHCTAAFVTKLNPFGTNILWSTYVGGSKQDGSDAVYSTGPIALDGNGNVYIEGSINYIGFPMINAVEPLPVSGGAQVLIAELDPTGSQLLFSTNVGAKGLDGLSPAGMAVDSIGNIYLAGNVNGPDLITTPGAFQTTSPDNIPCCGAGNGFVAKISPLIPTETALNISPGTSPYGQEVTFTATVTPSATTSEVPLGLVSFQNAGVSLGSGSVNSLGVATFITSGLSAATYSVTATYSGDDNFMASTSTPKSLVISGGEAQAISFGALPPLSYGAAPIALTAIATSELPVSYSVSGPAVLNGSILNITGTGLVSVTASQPGNSNWSAATPVTQSFTVAPALLTLTATNANIAYGQPIPALTFTIAGFVNNDPPTAVNGSPVESTVATSASASGNYPITLTQGSLSAANYAFAFVNGTLNISAANQTITFAALGNVTYGAAPITLTAIASSQLAVTYSVTGPARVVGSVLTIMGAGEVTVTASQAGNANYAAANPIQQSFTVLPAILTVKANNATMAYGQPTPSLTFTPSGFVNNDTASVLSGVPAVSTTGTSTTVPGSYPITIAQGTLSTPNYSFAFVNGTLTITIAAQTITFAQPVDVMYGSGPIALNATASSGLPVAYLVSGPATLNGSTLTISGVGTVTVVASQAGSIDYSPAASISRSFNVTPATQTIMFNTIPPQRVGSVALVASASSGLPVSFSSLTTAVCTISGTTATLLFPGTCTVRASQAGNINYLAATPVNQSFQVSAASTGGFTIIPDPKSEVVARGNLAGFILDIRSLNGFKGNVKLTCAGGPAGTTCVNLPQTVYLYKEAFAVAGIVFPKNTKPATYTITFTGTSGSLEATATATFTVK